MRCSRISAVTALYAVLALASIMPVVVPAATTSTSWYFAASAAVATWVLSPISTRKNDTTVVRKTPMRQRLYHEAKPNHVPKRLAFSANRV